MPSATSWSCSSTTRSFVLRQHRATLGADDDVFWIVESRVVEQTLRHTKHLLKRASEPVPYEPRVLRLKALTANL